MSIITVVRHAQASFLEEDYDTLSPLGETQASALGDYWARSRLRLDHVFSGPRKRHVRTAQIVGSAYNRAGLPWPEPAILPEFDEYKADEVIRRYLPSLAEKHAHVRMLNHKLVHAKGTPRAAEAAESLFRAVTTMWVRQEFDCGEVESWDRFCWRVKGAFGQVNTHGTKRTKVVVFSSAGPTAVAMQAALNLVPLKTLELSWLVRKCACSEFLASGKQMSLRSFNAVPYFLDPALVTYR